MFGLWDDPIWNRVPMQQPAAPRPEIPPLAPPEEDSILKQIAGAGLGGIGYVGSVLEKTFGGRAIRGLLGGKPQEALSILPFSDTLGITNETDRVSGRDLLRQWGAIDQEDTWGNFFGGLGLELATDPGMYMSFGGGALTRAGQTAKKIQALPATTTERVRGTLDSLLTANPALRQGAEDAAGGARALGGMLHEPLGYSVGFGLPLGKPVVGLGESGLALGQAAKTLAGGLDTVARHVPLMGGLYRWGADTAAKGLDVAGLYGRALFSPENMNAVTHAGQETARQSYAVARTVLDEARKRGAGYAQELKGVGIDPSGEMLRAVAEGTYDAATHGPVNPVLQKVADAMRTDMKSVLDRLQALGVDVATLGDTEINYLPRYWSPLMKSSPGHGGGRQPLVAIDPRVSGRKSFLKDIEGGTVGPRGINDMVLDANVWNGSNLDAATHVRRNYLGMGGAVGPNHLTASELRLMDLKQMPNSAFDMSLHAPGSPGWLQAQALTRERTILQGKWDQAQQAADWVRSLDPQYRASIGSANPLKFFGNHPLVDYEAYYQKTARLLGAAEASHDLLAKGAIAAGQGSGVVAPGSVPLLQALEQAGLKNIQGAQGTALQRINAARAGQNLPPIAIGDLGGVYVPEQYAKEIGRYMKGFTAPEAVSGVGSAFDALTNWTKAFQTAPWPAFHVRNLMSGLFQNYVKGMGDAPGGYFKQVADAYKLIGGEVIPDAHHIAEFARRGLSPQQATAELAQELYALGVGGHMPNIGKEIVGPAGGTVNMGVDLPAYLSRLPGETPLGVADAARTYAGMAPGQQVSWKPWNISGVGANADLLPPVAGGRQFGSIVEGVNRNSLYLSLRRQGYTKEAAAKEVLAAHFDYTRAAKTDFEAKIAQRAIPFYTYSRQSIPQVLEQLIQHPGGPSGIAAKAALDARQQEGFLPSYLGSGLATPLGDEEGGVRRYLTRTDLPAEQAFEILQGGPRWKENTLMAALGHMNPLIKGPLEFATGKQFFTGRDLADLYSSTGSTLADQIIANSPASRVATTLRTLADPRKWQDPYAIPLNLATGLRVSDVEMEKQRTIAAREHVNEALRGLPEIGRFETIFPKPGMEQFLTPAEWMLVRLNKTVEKRAQEEGRKKREQAGR